jgi:hypothetical protein
MRRVGWIRPMIDRVLADAALGIHLLYIVFVVLGGLLAARWPWVAWIHVPAAAWGALVELYGFWCPLTPLENYFRERAGLGGYQGGFIEEYLLPLIYPGRLTRAMQLGLGAGVVLLNLAIYAWIWRHRRRAACTGR